MKRQFTAILSILFAVLSWNGGSPATGQEIQYVERFALADDRAEALAELIPGTEDYYFYQCLHAQNTQRFDDVDDLVKAWITRHGETAGVQEILYRQALLKYPANPAKSLEFIRAKLNLRFDHQPRRAGQSPQLPTVLDQADIDRQRYFDQAIRNRRNVSGFRDSALAELVKYDDLTAEQKNHLLTRLRRPDYDGLVELLNNDKKNFGTYPVQAQLLRRQLDEIAQARPGLLNHSGFINTYLSNLQAGPEVDWLNDLKVRETHLEKVWQFVRKLSHSQNSLKAHVLYHLLVTKEQLGNYDRSYFTEYVRLPRESSTVSQEYLKRIGNTQTRAALNADFRQSTLLNTVGNDEPLIRSYLASFFRDATDRKEFAEFLQDNYLKRVFAETKILNGLGDIEQWTGLLPPAAFKELRERVDIEFAATSKKIFGRKEVVGLDVAIKNVDKLIVKIYEINALNYYLEEGRELNTDLELDGLTANWQQTFEYDLPPFRRVTRHFELPELDHAGNYVVDFIGNGRSSRALIRKGQLVAATRPTAAGHAITVFDEERNLVPDAKVYLSGREFSAGESGYAMVPYTTNPGNTSIVLSADGVASLHTMAHQAERYSLSTGFYVDRESLLRREKGKVIIRPLVTVNGAQVSVKALRDVSLTVTTVDLQGIRSTKTIDKFELFDDKDSVYDVRTPAHLGEITFTLNAKIRQITTSTDQSLVASASFSLNGIRNSKNTMNALLTRSGGLYAIDLRGLTGEALGDLPLQLTFHHEDFTAPINKSLKTSRGGRTILGPLAGITKIQAKLPDGAAREWSLRDMAYRYPATLHTQQGKVIDLPYLGNSKATNRREFSLLELRGKRTVADHFSKIRMIGGRFEISGLPVGDHRLTLTPSEHVITIRVSAGDKKQDYLVGQQRILDADRTSPMFLNAVGVEAGVLKLHVANANEMTRLHLFATRYISTDSAFDRLNQTPMQELGWLRPARQVTNYVEGRNIGDELRYIIDRQYLKKYPGNLLDPPSLLINPWAVRSTETGTQAATVGSNFAPSAPPPSAAAAGDSASERAAAGQLASAFLDFLPSTATVLTDIEIDENGMASIPLEKLDGKHLVNIVAMDHQWTDFRRIDLEETAWVPVDLRLDESFPTDKHLAQQRRVHQLQPGDKLTLREESTSRLQVFDDLGDVYTLYQTLLPNDHLREFGFLMQWHVLSAEQKRTLYKKHASHELHLFLARRDAAFFQSSVLLLIANKKEKQFMDHYLLGDDLNDYFEPWSYQRLNVLERALLASRYRDQVAGTSQHFGDLLEKAPINRAAAERLMETVLSIDGQTWSRQRKTVNLEDGSAEADSRETKDYFIADQKGADAFGRPAKPESAGGGGGGGGFGGMLGAAGSTTATPNKKSAPSQLARRNSGLSRGLTRDLNAKEDMDGELLFRQADKTMEWAESQYYRIESVQQATQLVQINRFWRDVVEAGEKPLLSAHFPEAARSFTEAIAAMALLDLPLKGDELELEFENGNILLSNETAALIVYEESAIADVSSEIPVLASQRFYIDTPAYQTRNVKHDHEYVTDEFITGTVYGCQIVVTNPTAENREFDVLVQVPQGSIPIGDSRMTRTLPLDVPAFQTKIINYSFYFPIKGDYTHYPVHVAHDEKIVAFTESAEFTVVDEPSKFNTESWPYVSQRGSDEDVLTYLRNRSLDGVQLNDILYRLKNREFFDELLMVLEHRFIYDHTVWSYAVHHQDDTKLGAFLQHDANFIGRCGPALNSEILTIDPILRGDYQHLEYRPLINARTHQLGKTRRILNDRLHQQYHRLLNILAHQSTIEDTERLAIVYYLAAQNRVAEAIGQFGRIAVDRVAMKVQYDYMAAYLDFFAEEPSRARDIADRYKEFPVEQWQEAFAAIRVQLDEIEGESAAVVDKDNRDQNQGLLASTEATLSLVNQGNQVTLASTNVDEVTLNFYAMDIEVLFSRNPFVQEYSNKFSFVRPNATSVIQVVSNEKTNVSIPEDLRQKNVLVEARGGGKSSTTTLLANTLRVNLSENYGQLQVTSEQTKRPLHTVYVKVYARHQDGSVHFFKDGYTDLRGRFDYASLSTNQLDQTQRLSILVLSGENGALIREVAPPAR
jgi:hypothetical protein